MNILITGGTGFIGAPLVIKLLEMGHSLTVLSRQSLQSRQHLRYVKSLEQLTDSEAIDAVINLAGASLADHRWNAAYKRELLSSRLDTTQSLLQLMQRLEHPPQVLLSASAIGLYGHHGDELLAEDGAITPGFAQSLCQQWEDLALQAQALGVRVCLLRLGVVLDAGGGAFTQMALPFRFGLGNWLGRGDQWLSWVHRRDALAAIIFLLEQRQLSGPFNVTAPEAVTSRGFCDAMRNHRRTLLNLPVPALVMRVLIGEMADELLLNGQRVVPHALQQSAFNFEFPDIDAALADMLHH